VIQLHERRRHAILRLLLEPWWLHNQAKKHRLTHLRIAVQARLGYRYCPPTKAVFAEPAIASGARVPISAGSKLKRIMNGVGRLMNSSVMTL